MVTSGEKLITTNFGERGLWKRWQNGQCPRCMVWCQEYMHTALGLGTA